MVEAAAAVYQAVYQQLVEAAADNEELKPLEQRSLMRLASNEHYALALQELGGVNAYNNPELLGLVKDRCHVISAT